MVLFFIFYPLCKKKINKKLLDNLTILLNFCFLKIADLKDCILFFKNCIIISYKENIQQYDFESYFVTCFAFIFVQLVFFLYILHFSSSMSKMTLPLIYFLVMYDDDRLSCSFYN